MWRRSIAAARSAAAYGDDFTVDGRPSHLHLSSPFAPFSNLIEDPEANIMRSIQWHPVPSGPHKPITSHQRVPKTRRGRKIIHVHTPPRAPVAALSRRQGQGARTWQGCLRVLAQTAPHTPHFLSFCAYMYRSIPSSCVAVGGGSAIAYTDT